MSALGTARASIKPRRPAISKAQCGPIPKFYPGIELLRGLSALWVMLFHLDSRLPSTLPLLLQPIAAAGWMGVDLFFAISGFVIARSAWRHAYKDGVPRCDRPHADHARSFFSTRLARVLPLYVFTCVACALVWPSSRGDNLALQILTHAVFVHNLFPTTVLALNPVSWSLAVEMQLYVLTFFLIPLLARMTWALPRALLLCLAAVLISTLTRTCGVLSTDDDAIGVAWRVHVSLQTPALLEALSSAWPLRCEAPGWQRRRAWAGPGAASPGCSQGSRCLHWRQALTADRRGPPIRLPSRQSGCGAWLP